jgi:UDP-glucose 4-epimerase
MQGQPLSIFGDGEQQRAFSYVGDIVPAIAAAPLVPEARQQVFNIGADVPYTVNALADTVRAALGVPDHPVVHHPARDEVKHAFSDHSKVRRVFGDLPATDLATGVGRMAAWALEHGPRESSAFDGIEIERHLPVAWLH